MNTNLIVNANNIKFDKSSMVNNTFYVTYAFLLTTATITFIEAISTKTPQIRHIMNLETVISVVAAYFYKQFMDKLQINKNLGRRKKRTRKKRKKKKKSRRKRRK